jgi:hypothetical protein
MPSALHLARQSSHQLLSRGLDAGSLREPRVEGVVIEGPHGGVDEALELVGDTPQRAAEKIGRRELVRGRHTKNLETTTDSF